jgi:transposase-like protein
MGKRRGRPPKGVDHVDSLPGDPEEKERLKVILQAIIGELPVQEACRRLSVSESRFHELRQQALAGMLLGLAPRPPGRPPAEPEPDRVQELKAKVRFLEEELQISRVQAEVAAVNPSILRDPVPPRKKKGSTPPRTRRSGRRRRPVISDDTSRG